MKGYDCIQRGLLWQQGHDSTFMFYLQQVMKEIRKNHPLAPADCVPALVSRPIPATDDEGGLLPLFVEQHRIKFSRLAWELKTRREIRGFGLRLAAPYDANPSLPYQDAMEQKTVSLAVADMAQVANGEPIFPVMQQKAKSTNWRISHPGAVLTHPVRDGVVWEYIKPKDAPKRRPGRHTTAERKLWKRKWEPEHTLSEYDHDEWPRDTRSKALVEWHADLSKKAMVVVNLKREKRITAAYRADWELCVRKHLL